MKIIAKILLFIFVAFLSTPVIVSAIEKNSDTSIFFNCAEEEKSFEEAKGTVYLNSVDVLIAVPVFVKSKEIISENIVKLENISPTIFVPPPNDI